jgi:hypothetical protein
VGQTLGDAFEQAIAHRMALRVVHILKVIEIEIKHCNASASPLRVRDCAHKARREHAAVEQPGEHIELRHPGQFFLVLLAAADVTQRRQQIVLVAKSDRPAPDLGPELRSILPSATPFEHLRRSRHRQADQFERFGAAVRRLIRRKVADFHGEQLLAGVPQCINRMLIDVDDGHCLDVVDENRVGYGFEDGTEAFLALPQLGFLALEIRDVDDGTDQPGNLAGFGSEGEKIRQVITLRAGVFLRSTSNLDVEHRLAAFIDRPV